MKVRFVILFLLLSLKGFCFEPSDTLINGKIVFKTGKKIFKKWKLLNPRFELSDTIVADSFYSTKNNIVRSLNGQKQIINPRKLGEFYADIQDVGGVFFIKTNTLWGIMNKNGKMILPCEYDSIMFVEPNFLTSNKQLHQIIDSNGHSVALLDIKRSKNNQIELYQDSIKQEFDSLSNLGSKNKLGWKNGKASLLDSNLYCVSDFVFNDAKQTSDSTITAFDKQSVWHFNLKNDSVCMLRMSIKWLINDTLGLVQIRDTLFGVYHFKTDTMMYFEADSVWRHPNLANRLMTKRGDTLGLASIEGRLLTNYERKYRYIGLNEGGFLQVISKKYFGFIDTNGYLLIATQYDSVKKVTEGFAAVKMRGKWGFVDRKERIVVQPLYQKVDFFMNGNAPVWSKGLSTLVNSEGKELFPPRFKEIKASKLGHWITFKNGRYGLLYSDGREAHIPKFERIEETSFGFYIVKQYGKEGILNSNLEIVLPLNEIRIENVKETDFFVIQQ